MPPDPVPVPPFSGLFGIQGYTNFSTFDFTGCPALLSTAQPAWDGSWNSINYVGIGFLSLVPAFNQTVNGKRFVATFIVGFNTGLVELHIQIKSIGPGFTEVWKGQKFVTGIPGVYTKVTGCSPPASLTVIPHP